jgi:hypothetical protein
VQKKKLEDSPPLQTGEYETVLDMMVNLLRCIAGMQGGAELTLDDDGSDGVA